MGVFVRFADRLSEASGRLAAWVFFAIGLIITYEVVLRYVFTAPTIWVDETARIGQIWATYLAAAFALKHRELIVIDVAFRKPGTLARKLTETFALLVIGLFCCVTVYYGFGLWLDATLRGHTTDTVLALPAWFTDASVWLGFALLAVQAGAEFIRLWSPRSSREEKG
ncbi:TRAP transporter small permease [Hoeflea poritis]|uniref:TRAP transporter small permease protein n=1 Tax=Hoeflea poritis TaxID=2993659 RepID=A0ABT4VI60_9HYPH|nr:TRAP transporter small permease [Hoeflea poritis]MDA4844299.1 TRAP transporter small permease [Hoeflea poritis]